MKILLLRHGIAEDGRPGMRDADRALTREGIEQLEAVAGALETAGLRCDGMWSSPFRRAVETAGLVRESVGFGGEVETTPDLVPDAPVERVLSLLDACARSATVMLVGHEPHLSLLGAWLVGARGTAIHVKKAGLVRVDIDGRLAAGTGELRWLLTPGWMVRASRPRAR